jgi:uncharacterized protein
MSAVLRCWCRLLLPAALVVALVAPALADYDAGMTAYHSGNFAEALRQFRADAEAGNAPSQAALAVLYARGEGVEKDMATAAVWFGKAAAQGHAGSQHLLGRLLMSGALGKPDTAKAIEWFEKAAAQGYGLSDLALFSIYYKGNGVTKDLEKAELHARRAAESGLPSAQLQYGYFLLGGDEGVARRVEDAYFWLYIAAHAGLEDAIPLLTQIPYEELPSERRLEIERQVAAWREKRLKAAP